MLPLLAVTGVLSASAAKWVAVEGTSATTLVGVGAQTDVRAVAAAASNGVGAIVERYDGEKWGKEAGVNAGLLLDAAVGTTYTVAASIFPVLISADDGKNYKMSSSLYATSQSAHVNNDVVSLVGTFVIPNEGKVPSTAYGVASSSDGGDSWTVSEVPAGSCRYGSFPSDNVWYVSSGFWGSDPEAEAARNVLSKKFTAEDLRANSFRSFPLSARAHVSGSKKGGISFRERNSEAHRSANATDADTPTGWWGTISKTVDGGKTFSPVFQSDLNNDYYYFNSISCSSETHCVAVAEGDDAVNGGYAVLAFVTFDGGLTWTNSLNKDNTPGDLVSIMGAAWVNDQEGWLGATAKDRSQLNGVFFHTTDGGKTYSVEETLNNCFLMDMTFANGVGYASCSTSTGSNGYVAMYV